LVVSLLAIVVLWQVSSCCCCLGGAVSPSVTPVAPSPELAHALRDRAMSAKARRGRFSLTFTDQELTSYVIGLLQSGEGDFPARDMQILFREGYVEIWATFIEIAPTDVPTYVRATVQARDGQLDLEILEANSGPFPVPGAMREAISRILSESLAELQLALSIDEVAVSPGQMTIRGEVTGSLPDLP
jgi:hypothetical protein